MKIKKNIRVAIIGYGSIGKRHLNIIQKLVKKEKIIVLTRKKIINNEIKFTNDLKEIIKFKPEISIICNAASDHIGKAQTLIKVSSKVFIEKPLSDSSKKIINFLKVWKKNKKPIIVGYNLRYLRSLIFFRKVIKKKIFGKILSIRCEVGHNLKLWRPKSNYTKTVSAQRKLGGGVLLELSHEFDYLPWLFGKPSWIYANISKVSNLKIDTEDNALMLIGFKSKKYVASVNMDFIRKDSRRTCTVIGSKTSIKWDLIKNQVYKYDLEKKIWKILKFKKNLVKETYKEQLNNILNKRYNSKDIQKKLLYNLNILKLIESAKKSDIKGKKIKLV